MLQVGVISCMLSLVFFTGMCINITAAFTKLRSGDTNIFWTLTAMTCFMLCFAISYFLTIFSVFSIVQGK